MSSSITSPSLSGIGASYIPDLTDTADIQTALKLLYYGSTQAATTSGIYGALTYLSGSPTFSGSLSTSATTASLFNTTATTLNIGGAATTLTLGASTGTTTIGNGLVISAGTTTKAPLKLTSGTNLTTPSAGSIEYDGSVFYGTPSVNNTTAGRGQIPTNYFFLNNADLQIFNLTTATTQTISLFNKSIYLAANTTYELDAVIYMNGQWNVSAPTTWKFTYPTSPTGTVSVLDVKYSYTSASGTYGASGTTITHTIFGNGAEVSLPTMVSGNILRIAIKGIVKTSTTAGNFAITNTVTNPGGSNTTIVKTIANSYIKMTPIAGTSTADINIGAWA